MQHLTNHYLYRDRYICVERVEILTEEEMETVRTWNRPYMNNALTILFMLQGRLDALVEGSRYELKSGELCLLNCLEACQLHAETYPAVFYRVSFSPFYFRVLDPTHLLARPFEKRPMGVGNRVPGTAFDAQALRSSLLDMEKKSTEAEIRLNLIVLLVGLLYSMDQAFPWELEDTRPEETRRVLEYIQEHSFEDMDLASLTGNLYLSRSQLSSLVKKSTGYAVWDYVLNKRIYRSIRLLHEGMSNRMAAQAVGFRDYSAFYKAFHKILGRTPTQEHPATEDDPLLARFYEAQWQEE